LKFKIVSNRRFEMIWARHLKLFAKLGMAALALGALAASGKAQTAYQGKFTLPAETHWGGATLPAGDYTFALSTTDSPSRLYVRGQGVAAIITATTADDGVVAHRAQLNLVDIGDVPTVYTFEAPELGVTFTYWTPTQKHRVRNEAHQKPVSPNAPASQVSDNKTSIEVHTVGR
jgi:hypothetical protein